MHSTQQGRESTGSAFVQSCRRAFTLIELLVVIAVIALLIGILLPALGKARDTARTTKCLANVRSMGMIMTYYANDFKNWYPIIPRPTNYNQTALDDQGRFGGLAAFFSLKQDGHSGYPAGWTAGAYLGSPGNPTNPVLKAYMDNNYLVLNCPNDKDDVFYTPMPYGTGRPLTQARFDGRIPVRPPTSPEEVVGYTISYLYIAGLKTDEPGIPVPPPLWGDESLANDYGTDAWYGAGGTPDASGAAIAGSPGPGRYGKFDNHGSAGANFGYADGHAAFVTESVHDKLFGSGANSINAVNPNRSRFVQTVD